MLPIKSTSDLYSCYYQEYHKELKRVSKANSKVVPLHLYSFRVYLASINLWKLINRNKLTQEEIDIMNQIGCYRLSITQLGIPRYRSKAVQM